MFPIHDKRYDKCPPYILFVILSKSSLNLHPLLQSAQFDADLSCPSRCQAVGMDEATLEAAIAAYGAQLQQVEMALSAGLDPSQQPDLLKLKEDLCQLIELTEASLVSVKKSRLLASLEDSNEPHGNTCEVAADTSRVDENLSAEFAAFYSELGECSGSGSDSREKDEEGREGDGEEEEDEEGEDALSGTKVRAPYRTSWGTLEYHNAMVVGAEPPDGEEAQVRVLFVYPTQKSMKPCLFYLEDKCRFQENCRYTFSDPF